MRWFRRSVPPEPPEHGRDADSTPAEPTRPTVDPLLGGPGADRPVPADQAGTPPAVSGVPPLAADLRTGDPVPGRPDGLDAVDAVAPVTVGRLEQALRHQGYHYRLGADGSLGGNWDGSLFSIALVGPSNDVLQVRGTWHRTIDAELAPGIAQVINDWNRDRIWPKVYTRSVANGLRAHSEVSVDVGEGASQAQVAEVIACGLGAGVQFFAALGDLLPAE